MTDWSTKSEPPNTPNSWDDGEWPDPNTHNNSNPPLDRGHWPSPDFHSPNKIPKGNPNEGENY